MRILESWTIAVWTVIFPTLAWAGQGVAVGAAPIEIGVSLGPSDGTPTIGPIVAVNFGPRDALEFSAALGLKDRTEFTEDVYTLQYRRTVYRANRGAISLTAGGSLVKSAWHYQTRVAGVLYRSDQEASSGAVTTGVSGSWDLTRRLTFRAAYQLNIGPEPSSRILTAIMIPVGTRPPIAGTRAPRVRAAEIPPTDPLRKLRTGQTVWVTTANGREIKGDVVALGADSLELAQNRSVVQLARSDIQRIETADGVADGLVRGLLIGAGAGVGLTLVACSSGCYEYASIYLLMSALAGTGTGALIGTLGDSLIDHRRVVYEASSAARIRITPVVSPTTAGLRATLQW